MDMVQVLRDWVAANEDNFFASYISILAEIIEFIASL